jgi:rRNA maturation endonuclease Nob1
MLKLVCAWCGKTMREGDEPASHGICEVCYESVVRRIENNKRRRPK